MAERLRWWVIPGAVVVLLRIVTLDSGAATPPATSAASAGAIGPVVVRDASGQRSEAVLSLGNAFVLRLPDDWAGVRVSMRAWRRIGDKPDASPWFTATPRVRRDATLPIAGMQAGRYDVEIVAGEGTARRELRGSDLALPGTHELVANPAPR
jgi:hypothetical protein